MKQYSGCALLHHSVLMLWRNRKSYAMLSVTIILSFSLLLGYLAFTDSQLYNRYKHLFSLNPETMIAYSSTDCGDRHYALENQATAADQDAQLYHFYSATIPLVQYGNVYASATFLPSGSYPLYTLGSNWNDQFGNTYNYCEEIKPIAGRDSFSLVENEAIINQSFYEAVRNGREFPFTLSLPIRWEDGTISTYTVTVVGICDDKSNSSLSYSEYGTPAGYVQIYLSQSLINESDVERLPITQWNTWICSKNPQVMTDYAKELGMVVHSVIEAQTDAMETMRIQVGTKGTIAAVLLLLLGINLYSSFVNALSDRKFEIGVKRAIGAPGYSIVGQFLIESILVMLINILFSVVLVAEGLIFYKLYQRYVMDYQWSAYVSGYSISMFALCAVTLTLVFSLLFAYRSTQVEVVAQLKSE